MIGVAWKSLFLNGEGREKRAWGAGRRARSERGALIETRSPEEPSQPARPSRCCPAASGAFGHRDKRPRTGSSPKRPKENVRREGNPRGHLGRGRRGGCRAFWHWQDEEKPSRTRGRVPTLVHWLHGKMSSLRAGWPSSWKNLPEISLQKARLKPVGVALPSLLLLSARCGAAPGMCLRKISASKTNCA